VHRPKILWFDMTLATQHAELDPMVAKYFDVHHCTNVYRPEDQYDFSEKFGLCFEFDYPDRPGLELMRATKERIPQLPVFMITSQHSERLAIWAYRNGIFDFLVKPVGSDEIQRCLNLISRLQSSDEEPAKRNLYQFRSTIPTEIPAGQRKLNVRLAPAIHYVEKNFRGKIRNAHVAEICGMSTYHFSHEFTDEFSLTFQDFVIRYRILQACQELRHPNIAVGNVAYSVGFNDPSYFSRVFRRYVGCSPSEFSVQLESSEANQRITDIAEKLNLPDVSALESGRRKEDRRQLETGPKQTSAT
jgi:two-component system response regulator YesN